MKLISTKFNNEQLRDLEDLQDLLGIRGIYGADPKAIKLAIKIAIAKIKQDQEDIYNKVIPSLKTPEKALYFTTISNPAKKLLKPDPKPKRP